MSSLADGCMTFMPREWIEAQGFVWADVVLAAILLLLVGLSYMMLAHMLRSWGEGPQNASSTAAGRPMRVHSSPEGESASGGGGAAAFSSSGGSSSKVGGASTSASGGSGSGISGGSGSSGGSGDDGVRSDSCRSYGPVQGEIDGMTALMRASSQGDELCASELIQAGASVDDRDSQEGFTALLMASAMGALACTHPAASHAIDSARLALPEVLSPCCTRIGPLSPHVIGCLGCVCAGHVGVVQRLLAAHANIDATNNDGATALMLATYARKEGVVRSLLESGARAGLSSALAFAEQADAGALARILRTASASGGGSLGWLGRLSWGSADEGSANGVPFDLGFLPLGQFAR